MNVLEFVKYLGLAVTLLPKIYEAVKAAEELAKSAQAGAWKKEFVLVTVEAVVDVADEFLPLDKAKVMAIVGKLIDAVVTLLNLAGEFKHADPTPA